MASVQSRQIFENPAPQYVYPNTVGNNSFRRVQTVTGPMVSNAMVVMRAMINPDGLPYGVRYPNGPLSARTSNFDDTNMLVANRAAYSSGVPLSLLGYDLRGFRGLNSDFLPGIYSRYPYQFGYPYSDAYGNSQYNDYPYRTPACGSSCGSGRCGS